MLLIDLDYLNLPLIDLEVTPPFSIKGKKEVLLDSFSNLLGISDSTTFSLIPRVFRAIPMNNPSGYTHLLISISQ